MSGRCRGVVGGGGVVAGGQSVGGRCRSVVGGGRTRVRVETLRNEDGVGEEEEPAKTAGG